MKAGDRVWHAPANSAEGVPRTAVIVRFSKGNTRILIRLDAPPPNDRGLRWVYPERLFPFKEGE